MKHSGFAMVWCVNFAQSASKRQYLLAMKNNIGKHLQLSSIASVCLNSTFISSTRPRFWNDPSAGLGVSKHRSLMLQSGVSASHQNCLNSIFNLFFRFGSFQPLCTAQDFQVAYFFALHRMISQGNAITVTATGR